MYKIKLVKIDRQPRFSDRVRTRLQFEDHPIIEFRDSTICKGQYQEGNLVSRAPKGTIGAVLKDEGNDGVWYWVIEKVLTSTELSSCPICGEHCKGTCIPG